MDLVVVGGVLLHRSLLVDEEVRSFRRCVDADRAADGERSEAPGAFLPAGQMSSRTLAFARVLPDGVIRRCTLDDQRRSPLHLLSVEELGVLRCDDPPPAPLPVSAGSRNGRGGLAILPIEGSASLVGSDGTPEQDITEGDVLVALPSLMKAGHAWWPARSTLVCSFSWRPHPTTGPPSGAST